MTEVGRICVRERGMPQFYVVERPAQTRLRGFRWVALRRPDRDDRIPGVLSFETASL